MLFPINILSFALVNYILNKRRVTGNNYLILLISYFPDNIKNVLFIYARRNDCQSIVFGYFLNSPISQGSGHPHSHRKRNNKQSWVFIYSERIYKKCFVAKSCFLFLLPVPQPEKRI